MPGSGSWCCGCSSEDQEETIIKAIAASETAFDTSMEELLALKNPGVSEKVISAMLDAAAPGAEADPVAAQA